MKSTKIESRDLIWICNQNRKVWLHLTYTVNILHFLVDGQRDGVGFRGQILGLFNDLLVRADHLRAKHNMSL